MAPRGVRCSARLSAAPPLPAPRVPPAAGAPLDGEAPGERRARAAERAREVEDGPRVLRAKCRRLARALRDAKHLVVYTGAGISTAADIPDYRGPRGVWTRLQRGETVGRVEVSRARPTFTHMALRALWAQGLLKFVVSQNCDGLHMRAGLGRRALASLHGDMFAERCAKCRALYLRACDVTQRTARHRHGTRRLCHTCGAELQDTIVHFGERGRAAWPLNWRGALRHAARADVVLCLGSSLKVLRRYGRLWRMQLPVARRPRLYIVNLQWTPKDKGAALKINARCDDVMRLVTRRLRVRVPRYRRARDPLLAHAEPFAEPERHTTCRPLLELPADHDHLSSSPCSSPSPSFTPCTSPCPSSDEELSLWALRDRLRAPPQSALRAFQVSMQSGDATILLRSEHAPPPPAPAPAPCPPPSTPRLTSQLRRVRIARHGAPLLRHEVKLERTSVAEGEGGDSHLRRLLALGPRLPRAVPGGEGEEEGDSEEEEGRSLAAAFFARAVLLCRAELYPGLHTILGAPLPPQPPQSSSPPPSRLPAPEGEARVECAWCLRALGSRCCLWWGPPRRTPLGARAWRREGARRYLCACCGVGGVGGGAGDEEARDADGGGWYGKGYRKGRRRR